MIIILTIISVTVTMIATVAITMICAATRLVMLFVAKVAQMDAVFEPCFSLLASSDTF